MWFSCFPVTQMLWLQILIIYVFIWRYIKIVVHNISSCNTLSVLNCSLWKLALSLILFILALKELLEWSFTYRIRFPFLFHCHLSNYLPLHSPGKSVAINALLAKVDAITDLSLYFLEVKIQYKKGKNKEKWEKT